MKNWNDPSSPLPGECGILGSIPSESNGSPWLRPAAGIVIQRRGGVHEESLEFGELVKAVEAERTQSLDDR
jgi:hypothetical protein